MIKVFYGDDRAAAEKAIRGFLGERYETIEGGELIDSDLPNIFWGKTFLSDERAILIKDILNNKALSDALSVYLDTEYKIVFWELKLDKRSSVYKAIKDKVEFREFKIADSSIGVVFDIYKVAKTDGVRAVKMLREIEPTQEPMMFVGLMASQAIKDFASHQGAKEKAALRALSGLDMCLKSTNFQAWTLIEAFLIRLATLRA